MQDRERDQESVLCPLPGQLERPISERQLSGQGQAVEMAGKRCEIAVDGVEHPCIGECGAAGRGKPSIKFHYLHYSLSSLCR
jgi:hypothetical protein